MDFKGRPQTKSSFKVFSLINSFTIDRNICGSYFILNRGIMGEGQGAGGRGQGGGCSKINR